MHLLNPLLGIGADLALRAEAMTGAQRLSILIFHRILAKPEPVFADGVDATLFDHWIGYLARNFRVLTLGEAVNHLQQRTLPARALVITFDDGYADNAELAMPILQRHGVAATFFISTGFLDGGCMWNDLVIHYLRHTPHSSLDLSAFGVGRVPMGTVAERELAIHATLRALKYLATAERTQALTALAFVSGVADRPRDLMMRSDQAQALARAGMEIGGHTVNHPILALTDEAEAAVEIQRGRQQLQALVDVPVDVFAYPNGQPDKDYTAVHVGLVRQAGFRCAVSTAKGTSSPGDDVFQLPRFMPWGDDARRLSARLAASRIRREFAVAKPG